MVASSQMVNAYASPACSGARRAGGTSRRSRRCGTPAGSTCRGARRHVEPAGVPQRRLLLEVPPGATGPERAGGVGVHHLRGGHHRVGRGLALHRDAHLGLGAHHAPHTHGAERTRAVLQDGAMSEIVALVDESGAVVGSESRTVVRRDNLLHAAHGGAGARPGAAGSTCTAALPDKDGPRGPRRGRRGRDAHGEEPLPGRHASSPRSSGVGGVSLSPWGFGLRGRHHPVRGALLRDGLDRAGHARRRRGGLGGLDDAGGARRASCRPGLAVRAGHRALLTRLGVTGPGDYGRLGRYGARHERRQLHRAIAAATTSGRRTGYPARFGALARRGGGGAGVALSAIVKTSWCGSPTTTTASCWSPATGRSPGRTVGLLDADRLSMPSADMGTM